MSLAKLREQAGKTQEELAAAAGLSQGAVTHIESGRTKNPTIATLRALCRALNTFGVACAVEQLLDAQDAA